MRYPSPFQLPAEAPEWVRHLARARSTEEVRARMGEQAWTLRREQPERWVAAVGRFFDAELLRWVADEADGQTLQLLFAHPGIGAPQIRLLFHHLSSRLLRGENGAGYKVIDALPTLLDIAARRGVLAMDDSLVHTLYDAVTRSRDGGRPKREQVAARLNEIQDLLMEGRSAQEIEQALVESEAGRNATQSLGQQDLGGQMAALHPQTTPKQAAALYLRHPNAALAWRFSEGELIRHPAVRRALLEGASRAPLSTRWLLTAPASDFRAAWDLFTGAVREQGNPALLLALVQDERFSWEWTRELSREHFAELLQSPFAEVRERAVIEAGRLFGAPREEPLARRGRGRAR